MIEEEYVSLEISKLLKEKGMFLDYDLSERSYDVYGPDGKIYHMSRIGAYQSYEKEMPDYRPKEYYPIVTQAVAMRWLREFHHYIIEIHYGNVGSPREPKMQWWWELENIQGEFLDGNITDGNTTYEEAAEAAIKYTLENLIISSVNK